MNLHLGPGLRPLPFSLFFQIVILSSLTQKTWMRLKRSNTEERPLLFVGSPSLCENAPEGFEDNFLC